MLVNKGPELLWVGESREHPGLLELVCFNGTKRHRRKDGACRYQRELLDQYADPDDVGRTLLAHYASGRGDAREGDD